MLPHRILTPPFFEIGPKAYLSGDEVVELAVAADRASARHGVPVLFTAPFLELERVVRATEHLVVGAPHMDPIRPGRGAASILPEALVAAGARAVMLNHPERPLDLATLDATLRRAEELSLATMVCAGSIDEIRNVAALAPDVIAAEPAELIGTASGSDLSYIAESIAGIRAINPRILVLQGAGIRSGKDVYRVIRAGADATGSSSGIATAPDKPALVDEMLAAVRAAWDDRRATDIPATHRTKQGATA